MFCQELRLIIGVIYSVGEHFITTTRHWLKKMNELPHLLNKACNELEKTIEIYNKQFVN